MNKPLMRGFTLIELLVVVLIIGILAAIALPRYQIAVGKTKVMKSVVALSSFKAALERYHLAVGSYPNIYNLSSSAAHLDVSIPIPQDTLCFLSNTNIICQVGTGKEQISLEINKDFPAPGVFVDDRIPKGTILCFTGGTIAKKICESLCGGTNLPQIWAQNYGCGIAGVAKAN